MKNIEASVGAVSTQGKKEEVEKEGETNIRKENEVILCLGEAPEYRISVVAVWSENARGEVVDQPDIYYRHISSGRLCQSVYACLAGVEHDQYAEEKWDTLCYRISTMLVSDLRRIVYGEKKYAVHAL